MTDLSNMRLKALEWKASSLYFYTSATPFGCYFIKYDCSVDYFFRPTVGEPTQITSCDTMEEAKAACQDHHETLVMALFDNPNSPIKKLEDLKGRVLCDVVQIGDEELRFHLTEDYYLRMHHRQDCCEYVYIEDIAGDLNDLVGTPILMAEEFIREAEPNEDGSRTWTYYRFRTIKGSVDIRWYGDSNGYYSERVDIEIVGGQ